VRGPPALAELYRDLSPEKVARGLPLHVTVLVPFAPLEQLGGPERARIRRLLDRHPRFEFTLTRLERWPEVLWLAPEPAAPLRALTDAVWAEFPDFPPYEGAFDEVIPHVTIAEGALSDDEVERLRTRVAALLPVRCRADDLTLLAEDEPGRWRERERFPLRVEP
jgi:2'-5' RNA ligase